MTTARIVRIEPSEFQVHVAIVDHLRHRARSDVVFFHPANGEHRHPRTAGKLKAMGVRPGTPDLAIVADGRIYFLEIKRHGGRTSPQQRQTMAALDRAGAVTAIAQGVDEALRILDSWRLLDEKTSVQPR
jgi:hypothetical protein